MPHPRRGVCLLGHLLQVKGITQTQLAERTGVSQRMISYYANNEKRMNVDAAKAIAAALNCRIEDLYKW